MYSGIGFMLMPSLSCESLNNWGLMLLEVASRLGQVPRSAWSSTSTSLQVLSMSEGVLVAFVGFPLFSFIFPNMPIFLFQSLKATGLVNIPEDWAFSAAVGVICYLIDVSIYGSVTLVMAFSYTFSVTEIGNLKSLFNDLR